MKGLLVGFESESALQRALARLRAEGALGAVETYTPRALQSQQGSRIPAVMFVAGLVGFVGFFALMAYADLRAYPHNIGGRPQFAWPAFIPIAFELGVLCAIVAGFVGFFIACRLPRPYDPVDTCDSFARASKDGWFLALRSSDADALAAARTLLTPCRPHSIEEFA